MKSIVSAPRPRRSTQAYINPAIYMIIILSIYNFNNPPYMITIGPCPWWRHQMETFSALLALCAGNSPVPGEFPAQTPVTRSFGAFFDLRLIKRLSKHSRGWWFETLSRHYDVIVMNVHNASDPVYMIHVITLLWPCSPCNQSSAYDNHFPLPMSTVQRIQCIWWSISFAPLHKEKDPLYMKIAFHRSCPWFKGPLYTINTLSCTCQQHKRPV